MRTLIERLTVKFLIDNWMLILIFLTSAAMIFGPNLFSSVQVGRLEPTQMVLRMSHEKLVVIDLNSPEDFAAGHVLGAKNVPWSQLQTQLPLTVKNKSMPLIFVCANGSQSSRAVATAQKLGYQQAHFLAGGLKNWKTANLPLKKD